MDRNEAEKRARIIISNVRALGDQVLLNSFIADALQQAAEEARKEDSSADALTTVCYPSHPVLESSPVAKAYERGRRAGWKAAGDYFNKNVIAIRGPGLPDEPPAVSADEQEEGT